MSSWEKIIRKWRTTANGKEKQPTEQTLPHQIDIKEQEEQDFKLNISFTLKKIRTVRKSSNKKS